MVIGGLTADFGVRTGTQSAGEFTADVELDVGIAHKQGLGVGVYRDELDPLEASIDHAVNCVDSATAYADHLDHCKVVLGCSVHGARSSGPDHRVRFVVVGSISTSVRNRRSPAGSTRPLLAVCGALNTSREKGNRKLRKVAKRS